MEITNFKIVEAINTLSNYVETKLPSKISYAILRNLEILQKEYKLYYKQLMKVYSTYKDYMEKDENGEIKVNNNNIPIVDSEHMKDFNHDITELLNIKIDVGLHYIDRNAFDYDGKDRYDPLSVTDIVKLSSILCKQDECKEEKD